MMEFWKNWLGVEYSPVSHKEKVVSTLGGLVAMLLLWWITFDVMHLSGAAGLIASMGASAVLLFAVPHGQLSQPWPVLAGHGFSALIGVACARWIPNEHLAAAVAVGVAIGAMHHFNCIHPPGGATALTAVLGGQAIHDLGFKFVLFPVLLNCVVMVLLAVAINFVFKWRRYPAYFNHRVADSRTDMDLNEPTHEEIGRALRSLDSFVDITEDDLLRLMHIINTTGNGRKTPIKPIGFSGSRKSEKVYNNRQPVAK
jgi:CBS domain-containing membrane protein